MLKRILLVLILLFLSACRPIEVVDESSVYHIMAYDGVPAISLLGILNKGYQIEITDSYADIDTAFEDNEIDIIIAPIDEGVEKAQEFGNYQLLSIVGNGEFYIVSKAEDINSGNVGVTDKDHLIGKVVDFLASTDLHHYGFIWYENNDELFYAFENNNVDAVLIDELNFNYLKSYLNIELFKIEDIQTDIDYQTHYDYYPMYGLFVEKNVLFNDQKNVVDFTKQLKNTISTYQNDKTAFNEQLDNVDLNLINLNDRDLISETYNYCGLTFKYANNEKDSLKNILGICGIELDELIIVE